MAKFQSPLLGYNNNVRHRGRIFHIQTEDSGVNHPHIITHLFMDGGRILKSVKQSYAQHVGSDGMSETVRVLMKEQHKAMFVALRDGQYDSLFEPAKKPSGSMVAPAVPPAAPPSTPAIVTPAVGMPAVAATPAVATPAIVTPAVGIPAIAAAPTVAPTIDAPVAASAPAVTVAAPPPGPPPVTASEIAVNEVAVVSVVKVSAEKIPVSPATTAGERWRSPFPPSGSPRRTPLEDPAPFTTEENPTAVSAGQLSNADPPLPPELEALLRDELPPKPFPETPAAHARVSAPADSKEAPEAGRHRPAQELTLDFDALERDSGVSSIFQQGDLPPPPKNLFAKEPRTGTYSAVEADAHHDSRLAANRPHASPSRIPPPNTRAASTFPRAAAAPPATPAANDGRSAPARPAPSFGGGDKPPPSSLFSDDLVSDKSLDEVILSYLAEDLEPSRRK